MPTSKSTYSAARRCQRPSRCVRRSAAEQPKQLRSRNGCSLPRRGDHPSQPLPPARLANTRTRTGRPQIEKTTEGPEPSTVHRKQSSESATGRRCPEQWEVGQTHAHADEGASPDCIEPRACELSTVLALASDPVDLPGCTLSAPTSQASPLRNTCGRDPGPLGVLHKGSASGNLHRTSPTGRTFACTVRTCAAAVSGSCYGTVWAMTSSQVHRRPFANVHDPRSVGSQGFVSACSSGWNR